MSVEKTDFAYWAKMPHWTLDEALALVFGKDPEVGTWKRIEHVSDVPFVREYRRVKKLALRAEGLWQSDNRVRPSSFLAWAKRNEVEVPRALVMEVELREKLTDEVKELRERIAELEQSAWEFDPDGETYPHELDIALQAWRAVTNQRDPSKKPKKQVCEWLDKHYPNLSNEAKQRIAIVCNWEKAGGKRKRVDN